MAITEKVFEIERKRLVDQVADHLMALIAVGQLIQGDRFPSNQ